VGFGFWIFWVLGSWECGGLLACGVVGSIQNILGAGERAVVGWLVGCVLSSGRGQAGRQGGGGCDVM